MMRLELPLLRSLSIRSATTERGESEERSSRTSMMAFVQELWSTQFVERPLNRARLLTACTKKKILVVAEARSVN